VEKWAKNHPKERVPLSKVNEKMKEILKILHDWVDEEHWSGVVKL
jgi:hypothetical protein